MNCGCVFKYYNITDYWPNSWQRASYRYMCVYALRYTTLLFFLLIFSSVHRSWLNVTHSRFQTRFMECQHCWFLSSESLGRSLGLSRDVNLDFQYRYPKIAISRDVKAAMLERIIHVNPFQNKHLRTIGGISGTTLCLNNSLSVSWHMVTTESRSTSEVSTTKVHL